MELFQLKYFLAVAKYEHVTKAAESLHIAQPAVSQAIRHLEEEFDTPLF
ncbi:MAG: LysR family transcriptional regulator, partial [Clostridium sp.]